MTDYPKYARSERIADAMMHGAGVLFAMGGTVVLIVLAALWTNPAEITSVAIYGAALILSFGASALYHFTPVEGWRPTLRRLDHAAIFFKIAGTYTPLVVLIGSAFGYVILAVVWGLAVAGAIGKLFFWSRPGTGSLSLYLFLGWLSVFLIWSLFPVLPIAATVLIAVGGLLYTTGVIFFNWERLRFSLAIWHGFVLAASICFFSAISMGVLQSA
jgi:hemolysin III